MNDNIGQAGDAPQAVRLIEVGNHRMRALRTPERALCGITNQRENVVVATEAGQHAAGNVTASDDQQLLHGAILPGSDISEKAMAYQVTIQDSQRTFLAEPDETILAAALRQGVKLPYGCREGACGTCRGRVLIGQVEHCEAQLTALSEADRQAGWALFCCARACSNLSIECREAAAGNDTPIRTLPARIVRLTRAAPDVMLVDLKLPSGDRLEFRAGQYIDILLGEGRRRAFSLANSPQTDGCLQLHVRHVVGGRFTDRLFGQMKERDILRLRGPFGSFFLRDAPDKPAVLVAGGTGFAPIKAIVEQAIAEGNARALHVYWGARRRVDLYLLELAERWARQHANVRFVPVLSDSPKGECWRGRTGLVHAAVMADWPQLGGCQVYVCGSPAMVAASRRDFLAHCGLPEEEFFADSFDFAADTLEAIGASDDAEERVEDHA